MSTNCIYYDYKLQKTIPCTIVPNKLYVINGDRYCKVIHDSSRFIDHNVTEQEINRYSTDQIDIFDLYPTTNQEQLDYANFCIPNKVSNSHKLDELSRFEQLITMLTDVPSINTDFFFKLADLLSYDLLFFYLNTQERVFMLTISTVELPIESLTVSFPGADLKPYLRSVKKIFDSYSDHTSLYYVQNIRNLNEFSYLTFPLELNIPVLKINVITMHNGGLLT